MSFTLVVAIFDQLGLAGFSGGFFQNLVLFVQIFFDCFNALDNQTCLVLATLSRTRSRWLLTPTLQMSRILELSGGLLNHMSTFGYELQRVSA